MLPRALDFGLEFDGFSLSGVFSLDKLHRMFDNLVARNDEQREAERHPPAVLIRIQCPSCGAPTYQLTCVEREEGRMRACRCCRHEFPVGV